MSQEQYNFLDELGLGKVIGNVKTMFAKLSHSHKLSDISDYTVDSTMSSTSTNPVQNKVINSALSGKVPTSRTINGKKLSSNITLSASDVALLTGRNNGNNDGFGGENSAWWIILFLILVNNLRIMMLT